MKPRLLPLTVMASALVCASPLPAQQLKPFRLDDDQPAATPAPLRPDRRPVLRAEPVRPPRPMADEPVATPLPVNPKGARPTPIVKKAKPVATPLPVGPKPAATPAPVEPTDPGEIRITPQGTPLSADQAQMQVADSFYNRKEYDTAASEYQRYLDSFPGGPDVAPALFRLGESHRKLGNNNSAKSAYERLLARFQVGDFVGPAAFRLAEIYYAERNYPMALPHFRKAAARLKEPAVVNAAKFYQARCLEATTSLGNKLEAMDLYRELADSKVQNPFMDASRLSLALLLHDNNRTSDALKNIQLLAKQTENPELKAQAAVRSGLWLLELKQPAKAEEELRRALSLPEVGPWKAEAQYGLLRMSYDSGKYQDVIDGYAQYGKQLAPDVQPEALLLVANAQRKSDRPKEALALYDRIIREYPDSNSAHDAQYEQLVTLYNTNSDTLVPAIDVFLQTQPDPATRDKVMLMKAETLFKKQDFAAAAGVYEPVSMSTSLTGTLKAEALFKLGWCGMQTHDFHGAIKAYTRFIDEYPTNKSLCSARVQRAIANQSLKNLAAAEKDYLEVIRKFGKCPEREFALQQEALVRGAQNDNAAMAEYFSKLLKDYPQTAAAAEAHYWIGRTAFESKDFKAAAEHLSQARALDEKYFEQASLSLMQAYYFLEDREAVDREVAAYEANPKKKGKVPVEVLRWLGDSYFESKNFEQAEKHLYLIAQRDEALPRDLLRLGQARLQLSAFAEAIPVFQKYLESVHEPISRATGLLELARAQLGARDFQAAQKSIDETLSLQPEGKISGEARIIAGDIQAASGHMEEAGKLYASVAVILDDDDVTPRALEKAYEIYQKAGREPEAKKYLNQLQSRYPEYFQKKKLAK